MSIPDQAPTWDLSSYFPSFDGEEYRLFFDQLETTVGEALQRTCSLDPLGENNQAEWVRAIADYEDLSVRYGHLTSYLHGLISCDAANEAYQLADARGAQLGAELSKVHVELLRAVRSAPKEAVAALAADPRMRGAEFFIRRLCEESRYQMSAPEEMLAADLSVDGIKAWGRLYTLLSSKMSFPMTFPDGREEAVPMSRRRSLMADPDRRVRREAFLKGNEVWAANEDTMAAALNAIAGTRLTLNRKRGVPHFLDVPLFDSALKAETLEAMLAGIESKLDPLRRLLRLGARGLGAEKMDWYDLEAALPLGEQAVFSWQEGSSAVERAFRRHYPALAEYYVDALKKRWVEAEPRPGKVPGAYCTGTMLRKEERVFMSYEGRLNHIMTLAHEFGHAWHSHVLEEARRPLAASYPMTLAETASTFAEAITIDGLLSDEALGPQAAAVLIDQEANQAHSFLVNIPVRFAFEKAFYEERMQGEVPVSRLKALMEEAQRRYYGDALGEADPYFWASKLHFFIVEVAFYNFPYAFGYLFSRAMFQRLKREGAKFLPKYEAFLKESGSKTCEEAAKDTLGVELNDPSFWAGAMEGLEELVGKLMRVVEK